MTQGQGIFITQNGKIIAKLVGVQDDKGQPLAATAEEDIQFVPQQELLKTAKAILEQHEKDYKRLAEWPEE